MVKPPSYQKNRLVTRNPRRASPPIHPLEQPRYSAAAQKISKMNVSQIEELANAIACLQFTNENERLDELIGTMRQLANDWNVQNALTAKLARFAPCVSNARAA